MYNDKMAHEAQKKWCEEHNAPHFAPGVYNNYRCSRCNQNIYSEKGHRVAAKLPLGRVRLDYADSVSGITVEKAGSDLICGCPFCYRSFDD